MAGSRPPGAVDRPRRGGVGRGPARGGREAQGPGAEAARCAREAAGAGTEAGQLRGARARGAQREGAGPPWLRGPGAPPLGEAPPHPLLVCVPAPCARAWGERRAGERGRCPWLRDRSERKQERTVNCLLCSPIPQSNTLYIRRAAGSQASSSPACLFPRLRGQRTKVGGGTSHPGSRVRRRGSGSVF